MHIKKGDIVQVLNGDDKGKRGKVLEVLPARNKIVIEGINRVYKHLRKSQRNPQGGRLSKEMPIDVSNVAIYNPVTKKPDRIGVRTLEDGRKVRFYKGNGEQIV